MIRYRDNAGCTQHSIARFTKHIGRLGKLSYIKGYRYRGRYQAIHEGVLIRGENGTLRFNGFCWGYGGEGPHGLKTILLKLGVDEPIAHQTAFHTPRRWPDIEEAWRITF
jgi:hypothetical protein